MKFHLFLSWFQKRFHTKQSRLSRGRTKAKDSKVNSELKILESMRLRKNLVYWFDECIYMKTDNIWWMHLHDDWQYKFHWPIFMGRGWGRGFWQLLPTIYVLSKASFSRGVLKDWGCIRKRPLGWLSGLALNSCSSLFYVAACLCVGGRKKKNTGDLPLRSKLKLCSAALLIAGVAFQRQASEDIKIPCFCGPGAEGYYFFNSQ